MPPTNLPQLSPQHDTTSNSGAYGFECVKSTIHFPVLVNWPEPEIQRANYTDRKRNLFLPPANIYVIPTFPHRRNYLTFPVFFPFSKYFIIFVFFLPKTWSNRYHWKITSNIRLKCCVIFRLFQSVRNSFPWLENAFPFLQVFPSEREPCKNAKKKIKSSLQLCISFISPTTNNIWHYDLMWCTRFYWCASHGFIITTMYFPWFYFFKSINLYLYK